MIIVQALDWASTLTFLVAGQVTLRNVTSAAVLPPLIIVALVWWTRAAPATRDEVPREAVPPDVPARPDPVGRGAGSRGAARAHRGPTTSRPRTRLGPRLRHRSARGAPGRPRLVRPRRRSLPVAIAKARARSSLVEWQVADINGLATLPALAAVAGRVDLILDLGCLHGLDRSGRDAWAASVRFGGGADSRGHRRRASPGSAPRTAARDLGRRGRRPPRSRLDPPSADGRGLRLRPGRVTATKTQRTDDRGRLR